jgi:hypothetical protein
MTRPNTKTDWLLFITDLSFFGWLLFGLGGLVVGPAYLLLSLALEKISAAPGKTAGGKVGREQSTSNYKTKPTNDEH